MEGGQIMATQIYKVRDPSGAMREIEGPVGATDEQVIAKAKELFPASAPASEGMPAARAGAAQVVEAEQPAGYNPFATAGSFFPSLYKNTVGNLVDVVSSPVQSAQGIGDIVAGGVYKALPSPVQRGLTAIETSPYNPLGNPAALQRAQAMASAAGQEFVRPYSSGAEFQKTMEQDPFRPISDVSALLGGGGAALRAANMGGRTATVANALTRGSELTNPINMLTRPVAAMVSPTVDPGVRALMAEGVTPTVGQILGGGFKRAEEGLTSIPVIGDFIKSAQARAAENVNRAAINRALTPINEKLPVDFKGRDAIRFASEKLDDAYGALLPKMTVVQDTPFQTSISNLRNMVDNGAINQASKDFFNKWIDGNVLNKFQGQGAVTGQTLKQVQSDLRETISRLGASTDADQRLIGEALKEAQDQVRQLVTRNNPKFSKELKAIDTGYANFKRVEAAAALSGAEAGIFSPAQLQSAVRTMDRSKDHSEFSKGQALMQDLSEPAKTILGNKLPDSGTPYRSLAALIASGGAGAAGYPAIAAGMLAGPALYSAPGQRLAAAALTARPAGAAAVANQLRANQGIKTSTLAANQLANQQQSAFDEFLRANAAVDPRFQQALEAGR
jgi:hypothetical protein